MRILITGATGFLGKYVLAEVLDREVETVYVVSRNNRTHPDPRVVIVKGDLSQNYFWQNTLSSTAKKIDHVIHLAGLYDFNQDFASNYRNNVLPALHLVEYVRSLPEDERPLIHCASTYAVGLGLEGVLKEEPLEGLPPVRQAYPYTKALAEKVLTDSPVSCRIFRVGVLIGDSAEGAIEKLDGPYYVFRVAWSVQRWAQRLSWPRWTAVMPGKLSLTLPLNETAVFPIVPVDSAARVFARSVFEMPKSESTHSQIFNMLDAKGVTIGELTRDCFKEFLPYLRVSFFDPNKSYMSPILKNQSLITGIPFGALEFGIRAVSFENSKFTEAFGPDAIPNYASYRSSLFSGFKSFMGTHNEHS